MQLSKYESDYLYFDSMAAAHKWGALCCSLGRKSREQQEEVTLSAVRVCPRCCCGCCETAMAQQLQAGEEQMDPLR